MVVLTCIFFVASFGEGLLIDFPAPGLSLYVDLAQLTDLLTFQLSGPAGVPGIGSLSLSYPVGPGLQGLTWFQQAFVLDLSTPSFLAQTNGMKLTFGI